MKNLPKINPAKAVKASLPYVLAGLLCTKLGEAYRLTTGGDVLDKLLAAFTKLGLVFQDPLPSFHPFDLLVGVVAAVLLRLVVWSKIKNAKKYRHGEEYGTARWVTFPLLKEAWPVMDAWGFSYKSVAFVWVKQNRKAPTLFTGMGYWTRANAEICLLATRGHPKRANAGVHQVILSHIEEHSKKPEEARSRIVRLMGDVPRIELFARSRAPGWDVWGNEAAGSIQGWPPQENIREVS